MSRTILFALLLMGIAVAQGRGEAPPPATEVLTGPAALGDWTTDAPGVRRRITVDDVAQPYHSPSAENHPKIVPRPEGVWPQAPAGFKVTQFATGLTQPRVITRAPNGDLFVAESAANQIRVLRDADGDGEPELNKVFATNLNRPFGIAFFPLGANPQFLYIGNTDSVVRFPYILGATQATGPAETIVSNIPSGNESVGGGGHWTRDLEFSPDGKTLYVAIGSRSNATDDASETRRAMILAFDPDGGNERVVAAGIRNPVGLATHPETGALWTSVNERDGLGDNLVPDYITHVEPGGFYGWPWY